MTGKHTSARTSLALYLARQLAVAKDNEVQVRHALHYHSQDHIVAITEEWARSVDELEQTRARLIKLVKQEEAVAWHVDRQELERAEDEGMTRG